MIISIISKKRLEIVISMLLFLGIVQFFNLLFDALPEFCNALPEQQPQNRIR